MIKCSACGTENLVGSQYCDECGTSLPQSGGASNSYSPPSYQPPVSEPSVFQAASVTSIGIEPIVEHHENEPVSVSESRQREGVRATLVIERGVSVGAEFLLTSDESLIGRWDADNGIFPDVDLDAHDPEAKVSRRHARIFCQNGKFLVEDLGSTNGTFINRGRRLIPGSPQVLSDGDEIIVGKTFLRFNVNN